MKEKCRPHRWQYPRPGDPALVCARCGRVLGFDVLIRDRARRFGVIRARKRIFGKVKGELFARALADALNYHEMNSVIR